MSSSPITNISSLDLIYNASYQYSVPKPTVEEFLAGKGFPDSVPYTKEEGESLQADLTTIYDSILAQKPLKERSITITCGAPAAGKTMKLQQDRELRISQEKTSAYICPDDVCLKNMKETYKKETAGLAAYNKWRAGSNAIHHIITAHLIKEGYSIDFGTTATGAQTWRFLDFLKKQGYTIRLLHITAPDNVRVDSIMERDKTFVQTTKEDIVDKGKLLPQRIQDTYLKYADRIEFYYRDGVKENALLAATWERKAISEKIKGVLSITDKQLYNKITTIHNDAVKTLSRPDLAWNVAVEEVSQLQ